LGATSGATLAAELLDLGVAAIAASHVSFERRRSQGTLVTVFTLRKFHKMNQ